MNDKKNKDGMKIHGISAPRVTNSIEQLSNVSEVEKTQKASAVGAVRGVGGVTGAVRSIDFADREAIHRMIHEEADKLFGKGRMDQAKREVIETAVKMAVDAATITEETKEKKQLL